MPTYIVKLRDKYLEWSTVVDAPTTLGMTLDEFREYYRHRYGERGAEDLPDRLARVERQGSSAIDRHHDLDYLISINRAGEWEQHLTEEELYQIYCERESWLAAS